MDFGALSCQFDGCRGYTRREDLLGNIGSETGCQSWACPTRADRHRDVALAGYSGKDERTVGRIVGAVDPHTGSGGVSGYLGIHLGFAGSGDHEPELRSITRPIRALMEHSCKAAKFVVDLRSDHRYLGSRSFEALCFSQRNDPTTNDQHRHIGQIKEYGIAKRHRPKLPISRDLNERYALRPISSTSFADRNDVMYAVANQTLSMVGLLTGFLIGLTGMGGGALLTPLLVLLGVDPATAVSSDVVLSLLIKPIGAGVHAKHGTIRKDLVGWLALGSIPAAFGGAALFHLLGFNESPKALEKVIGGALLLAATVQFIRLFKKAIGSDPNVAARPLPTVLVGVTGGVIVGLTSVGSGSLMLTLLVALYPRLKSSTLIGTDLAQAIPLVASASLGHLIFGKVKFGLVGWLLIGAAPGVWIGSQLSSRTPDRVVRPILVVVLLMTGMRLLGVKVETLWK